MNRYRQFGKFSTNPLQQQRIILDPSALGISLQSHENEIIYLNGFEVKRPNIISRGSIGSKLRYLGIQQPLSTSATLSPDDLVVLDAIAVEGGGAAASISFPMELISSEGLMVDPNTRELSLTIEPSIISSPVLPMDPPVISYDSTCVSQAIATPIVTPVISKACSLSQEYVSNSLGPQTIEVHLSNDDNELSSESTYPVHVITEEDASYMIASEVNNESIVISEEAIGSIYITSTDEDDSLVISEEAMDEVLITEEEEGNDPFAEEDSSDFVTGDSSNAAVALDNGLIKQESSGQHMDSNPVRIETSEDGSLYLYMESSEPIDIGSEAQIVQTETFPVVPNVPIELPNTTDGGTESYILLPVDDLGNTILVPTGSLNRKSVKRGNQRKRPLNGIPPPTMKTTKCWEDDPPGEKPKPFRYELTEEDEFHQESEYEDEFYRNLSTTSQIIAIPSSPCLSTDDVHQNMSEVRAAMESQSLSADYSNVIADAEGEMVIIGIDNAGEPILNEILQDPESSPEASDPILLSSNSPSNFIESSEKLEEDVNALSPYLAEPSLTIYRCKFCNQETRIQRIMRNHVNICHKAEMLNLSQVSESHVGSINPTANPFLFNSRDQDQNPIIGTLPILTMSVENSSSNPSHKTNESTNELILDNSQGQLKSLSTVPGTTQMEVKRRRPSKGQQQKTRSLTIQTRQSSRNGRTLRTVSSR